MEKKKNRTREYILLVVAVAVILAGWWLTQGNVEKQAEKPSEKEPAMYIVKEIVPGQVISIKPVRGIPNDDNFTQSMNKVKAGMEEVGRKYDIKSGQTIMIFTMVGEQILYVEPKTAGGNCTINIDSAENIIINRTNKLNEIK